jgi:hypothetical protein
MRDCSCFIENIFTRLKARRIFNRDECYAKHGDSWRDYIDHSGFYWSCNPCNDEEVDLCMRFVFLGVPFC